MQRYRTYLEEHHPEELRRIERKERQSQYESYVNSRNKKEESEPEEKIAEEEETHRNMGISSLMGLRGF